LALLREPGDDGPPESIYDDLASSYTLAVDGGAARISEIEGVVAEKDAEIARLKALNFDLLMAAGSEPATEDTDDDNENPTEPIGEAGIDSLFDRE
jgi:hypothetical protein